MSIKSTSPSHVHVHKSITSTTNGKITNTTVEGKEGNRCQGKVECRPAVDYSIPLTEAAQRQSLLQVLYYISWISNLEMYMLYKKSTSEIILTGLPNRRWGGSGVGTGTVIGGGGTEKPACWPRLCIHASTLAICCSWASLAALSCCSSRLCCCKASCIS